MPSRYIPVWKEAPFIRIILPFVTGILLQWYVGVPPWLLRLGIPVCILLVLLFALLIPFIQFKHYWVSGILINVLLINTGSLVVYYKDVRHNYNWIGNSLQDQPGVVVTIEEPLSEKNNSFKATASLNYTCSGGSFKLVKGNIIVYFEKDKNISCRNVSFNSRIIFHKHLEPVKNSGNPGAFDYEQYCAFQQIYHQVYLKSRDYLILPSPRTDRFNEWLFKVREKVVKIISTYIAGRKEAGLAEALLIGYKDDLDKMLVKSYSNTGVVHIIAISGLHVGLIYWLLSAILKAFKAGDRARWMNPLIIITGLWLFSLVAGGTPSVLRSAVMFTFVALAETMKRKTYVYNSLAASAFCLLCYNPFWLWDAGFDLSYIAVLSIVIFMEPVYNWFPITNKLLDGIWKLCAISIAAQILTTPLSIFLFHQFPVYFLVTNLLAVPLSSLIVLGEIGLCAGSFIYPFARAAGFVLHWLIRFLNGFIEYMEHMPFSTWGKLEISFLQLLLVYICITSFSVWLFQKIKPALLSGLFSLLFFIYLRTVSLLETAGQLKLIVYNIPHHQAIDFIQAHQSLFITDMGIQEGDLVINNSVQPARILFRFDEASRIVTGSNTRICFTASAKRVLILRAQNGKVPTDTKMTTDVVIISGSPRLKIPELAASVRPKWLVFDATNPAWKIREWKADCDKLGISCFSIPEKGAFILNLN